MDRRHFTCDPLGYVRHWLIAGPQLTPYAGPGGSDDFMRRSAADNAVVRPPRDAALGSPGPFGQPWRFYCPGANYFVECSAFHHQLQVIDLYAATEVNVPADRAARARFWACGTADLWVNYTHLCRYDVPRYMYPGATQVTLPLTRGVNRLCVRLQCLGLRDTRTLFGLQLLDGAVEVAILLPGPAEPTAQLAQAEQWLQGVSAAARDALTSSIPAPPGARVKNGQSVTPWPAGQSRFAFDPAGAFNLTVGVEAGGQTMERLLEIPANRPAPPSPGRSLREHRRRHLEYIAAGQGRGAQDVMPVIARRLLGRRAEHDAAIFQEAVRSIDARKDCADFTLAMLLRLLALGIADQAEAEGIKRVALDFRYWMDEPGTDAMCFGSENHRMLFHGCQLLAGRLLNGERFSNSGRTGAEQASIGARRCVEWLDGIEPNGFREFLSSSYMPITVAALMNLVDFSGDESISRRSAGLVDRILHDLAMHAFDGVTVGPQGRVYRNVLYPQTAGTQALLSYATTEAVVAANPWLVFLGTSKTYEPPEGLGDAIRRPLGRLYRQGDAEICLHKTGDYLLTSLRIPASFDTDAAPDVPPQSRSLLRPGLAGYQQHLWHATLGRDCHVFVNHPGASFDLSSSRPGYWYGNGALPRLVQREGMVLEIFDIPQGHPIHFTHAHWPADAFDRQEVRDHWAFGAKSDGRIALWCSERLIAHDEVLTGRELRAWGRQVGWACLCAGAAGAGTFDAFVRSCLDMKATFDPNALSLQLNGRDGLSWGSPARS